MLISIEGRDLISYDAKKVEEVTDLSQLEFGEKYINCAVFETISSISISMDIFIKEVDGFVLYCDAKKDSRFHITVYETEHLEHFIAQGYIYRFTEREFFENMPALESALASYEKEQAEDKEEEN